MQAAALIVVVLAAITFFLWKDNQGLRADISHAQAELEAQKIANAAKEAHLKRMAADAEKWGAIEQDLQTMEGHDAPLSPYLSGAARRVWP